MCFFMLFFFKIYLFKRERAHAMHRHAHKSWEDRGREKEREFFKNLFIHRDPVSFLSFLVQKMVVKL